MSAIFLRNASVREGSLRRQRTHERALSNISEDDQAGRQSVRSLSVRESSLNIPIEDQDQEPTEVDSDQTEETPSCLDKIKDLYHRSGLKHLLPVVILLAYTAITAYILSLIEGPRQRHIFEKNLLDLETKREQALLKIKGILTSEVMTVDTQLYATRDVFIWYEYELELRKGWDWETAPIKWDMSGAFFYVSTVVTTIGYGNIFPNTRAGQALTIVFAIFGIPLVLAILGDMGKLLCRTINKAWERCKKLCTCKRRRHSLKNTESNDRYSVASLDERSGLQVRLSEDQTTVETVIDMAESYLEDDDYESHSMPVTLALALCVAWMLASAGVFCIWETNWTFFESFYFVFISLSTVGLGDITPDHPKYMVLSFPVVIVGLSLVSMLISVIQMKIEEWLYAMMKKMQAEYERALAMGEGPDRDKILAKLMKKQPWYLKKLMPALMNEKQVEQLETMAEEVVKVSCNSKSCQTDTDQKEEPLVRPEPATFSTACVQTESEQKPQFDDKQMQTDSIVLVSKEVQVNPRKLSMFLPQQALVESETIEAPVTVSDLGAAPPPPSKTFEDKEVQASKLYVNKQIQVATQDMSIFQRKKTANKDVQTLANPTVQRNIGTQTVEQVVIKMPALRRPMPRARSVDSDHEDSAVQTDIMTQSDVVIQTNDSYLKIARRLDQLRTNRTPSLAISAVPQRKLGVSAPPSPTPRGTF